MYDLNAHPFINNLKRAADLAKDYGRFTEWKFMYFKRQDAGAGIDEAIESVLTEMGLWDEYLANIDDDFVL